MLRNIIYSKNCLLFCIMVGGAVYEHMGVVPSWSAAPPVSLTMFQGEYGLKPSLFWMVMHPVILAFFTINLVMHWRTPRRNNILIALASYIAILIITATYFVPVLLAITSTALSTTPDPVMTSQAQTWEILSLVRLAVLLILAMVLFTGLARSKEKIVMA